MLLMCDDETYRGYYGTLYLSHARAICELLALILLQRLDLCRLTGA